MEKIKDALKKAKTDLTLNKRSVSLLRTQLPQVKQDEILEKIVYNQENVVDIDKEHLLNSRIVALDKMNPASWTFDALRTQVLQKLEENNWKTIGIISPTAAAGKTVVAINLAISIAQSPQKTAMLVDFDMRKPKVSNYLGIKYKKSINDYLKGDADIPDIIINPSIPRFTVIPTAKPISKSSEVLSLSKVKLLISDLKEKYDSRVVIFDLPPILQADDAMVILPHLDCVLVVIGDGADTEADLKQTMRLLDKSNVLGVVVNRAEVEPKAYY
jgi:capsular exopolysaccharide synthesis family protein